MKSKIVAIPMSDGVKLFSEIVERGATRWIIMTHGIAEHSGRHHYLNNLFTEGWNICFYDLRGHGRSEGKRAYIDNFDRYSRDLTEVIAHLQKEYRMSDYILIGHSMGSLITADFLQRERYCDFYPRKVFLSAPPVRLRGLPGRLFASFPAMTRKLGQLNTSVPLRGLMDLRKLSHDPQNYVNYTEDPLVSQSLHSKLLLQLVNCSNQVFSRPLYARCPTASAIGEEDVIVDVDYYKHYFTEIEKIQEMKIIAEGYHELHNELGPYRLQYLAFLKSFCQY